MNNNKNKDSRFVVIEFDQKLLHSDPPSCCEGCYIRHEPKVVFHVTDDLHNIQDVIKAIQQQFGTRVAIKLTSVGAFLPATLPVSALWEFSSTVIVHPVDSELENAQGGAKHCNCQCHHSDTVADLGGSDTGTFSFMQVSTDGARLLLDSRASDSRSEKEMTEFSLNLSEDTKDLEGNNAAGGELSEGNTTAVSEATTDSSLPNFEFSVRDFSSTSFNCSKILSPDPSFAQGMELSSAATHSDASMSDNIFMNSSVFGMSSIQGTMGSTANDSSEVSSTGKKTMGPPSQNMSPSRRRRVRREAERIIEEVELMLPPWMRAPPTKKNRKTAATILGNNLPTEPTWLLPRRSSTPKARKFGKQGASPAPFRTCGNINIPPGSFIKFTYTPPGQEREIIRGKVTEDLYDRIKVKGDGASMEVQYEKAFMKDIQITGPHGSDSISCSTN